MNRLVRTLCLLGLLIWLVPALQLRADAVVQVRAMTATTIAEIFIDETGARVELEIGLVDLPAFQNLLPDELYARLGQPPRPLLERLEEFFRQDLVLAPEGGEPIVGRITQLEARERVIRDEITGEPLPSTGEPEPVIFVELFYPFTTRPAGLTISGPTGARTVGIGFVAYHRGMPVNDFRYLGRGYQLTLNWEDPWYSRFQRQSLRRAYEASMNGFLYVEAYEVRKEIIVRARDLEDWIDLGIGDREVIPAAAQAELTRKAAEFLREHHPVKIDGKVIDPELARINFLRRTLRNSTVVDPPEDLETVSATLGAIFVYPTEGLPQQVTMEWDLFNDNIPRVPVAAVDQAGPLPGYLFPDDTTLVWTNFLTDPELPTLIVTEPPPNTVARAASWLVWPLGLLAAVALVAALQAKLSRPRWAMTSALLALLCAGSFWLGRDARLSGTGKNELVTALLHNVYRAFDFRDEEKIYDVLAESVDGELLTDIYLETRRGLEIQNQGGARARVKELELIELDTEPGTGGGFEARAVWNVSGSVGHWGHLHRRTNRYRAGLGIEPVDGRWKLTALEILEEERLP